MAVAMIGPKFYAWDRNGKPLAFGKLYTYQARTNTPKPTYQSEDQQVENTNPVILNGEGYANVYLDGSYKMVLKDKDDNEIWSSDPVSSAQPDEWVNCLSATYISPTSFKVSGNFTDVYTVGKKVRIDNNVAEYAYDTIVSSTFSNNETFIEVISNSVTTGIVGVCASITSPQSGFSFTDLSSATQLYFESYAKAQAGETFGGSIVSLKVGDVIQIKDRDNAFFEVKEGLTPDGYKVLNLSPDVQGELINELKTSGKSYGVTGNGVTDDIDAINAANEVGGNTVKLLNNKTSAISQSLTPERFSSFVSEDKQSFPLSTIKWIGGDNESIYAPDQANQTLEGFTIDGNSKAGVKGVFVGNDTKFLAYSNYTRLWSKNSDIGFYVSNCFDTKLDQVRSSDNRIGIHVNPVSFGPDGGYTTTFKLSRGYITGNSEEGLLDEAPVKNKMFCIGDNTVFELNGDANHPQVVLGEGQVNSVNEVYIEDPTDTVTAMQIRAGYVQNAYINGYSVGIDLTNSVSAVVLDNIKFASGAGPSVKSEGGANSRYLHMRRCEFSGAPQTQSVVEVMDGCSGDMPSGIPEYSFVVRGSVPKFGVGSTPAITRNIEAHVASNAGTTVNANSQYRFNVSIPVGRITDGSSALSVTPQTQLPSGLMATVERQADTIARVVISNVTTSNIVLPAIDYLVRVEQFFQTN